MPVLVSILRVLLIWWIISIIFRWMAKDTKTGGANRQQPPPPEHAADLGYTGEVEDAEFEEIDNS